MASHGQTEARELATRCLAFEILLPATLRAFKQDLEDRRKATRQKAESMQGLDPYRID